MDKVACPHCWHELDPQWIVRAAGSVRGSTTSEQKAKAAAENGKKGGRPRKSVLGSFAWSDGLNAIVTQAGLIRVDDGPSASSVYSPKQVGSSMRIALAYIKKAPDCLDAIHFEELLEESGEFTVEVFGTETEI